VRDLVGHRPSLRRRRPAPQPILADRRPVTSGSGPCYGPAPMATTAETTSTTTVSRLLATEIAALGVPHVFSLMGEDTAALITSLVDDHGLELLTMRHESAAVMAADSYSWATGGLGVCVLSHGPGFTNGLTALTTAARSERKLLVVAGHDAHRPGMRPEMKRTDQAAHAAAAGLGFFLARDAEHAPQALAEAVAHAVTGRVALLAVPVDVLNSATSPARSEPRGLPASAAEPARSPSPEDVERVSAMLAEARRPLLVAGRGALHARDELLALAERTGALVGTTLLGKGLFRGHRLDAGVVGGWASDPVRPLLDDVDLVVAFGASLNSFTLAFGNLFGSIPIVQVDVDPSHLGAHYPVTVGVVADSRAAAEALVRAAGEPPADPELHRPDVLERIARPLYLGGDESVEGRADGSVLAAILDEMLPAER